MAGLELIFPTETRELSFNDKISDIRKKWATDESDYFSDRAKTFNEYLSYSNLDIELLFKDGLLQSVFIYFFDKSEEYEAFKGSCTYLSETFWEKPRLELFEGQLTYADFEPVKTGSRFTTKYTKGDLSCVYSDMEETKHVSFGLNE